MQNGNYVIRHKGTDLFYAAGGYHGPIFLGFFDAWSYDSMDAAIEAAEGMRIGAPGDEATLQVVHLANLPDIFDPKKGMATKLVEVKDKLGELEGLEVFHHDLFSDLKQTIYKARLAMAQQSTVLGAALAGNDVVVEVKASPRAALASEATTDTCA